MHKYDWIRIADILRESHGLQLTANPEDADMLFVIVPTLNRGNAAWDAPASRLKITTMLERRRIAPMMESGSN